MRILSSPPLQPRFLLLVLVAHLAAGCAATRSPDAVAEFATRSVSCTELREFATAQVGEDPNARASDLVQDYVVQQLLTAEARRTGLDRDPEVARRFRAARRSVLLESTEAALASGVEVTDADVAAYYESRATELNRPERIRTRMILRRLAANASRGAVAEQLSLLREVQAEFLSGAAFADLAVRYSQHESAAQGGVMEPWARGSMGPEFDRVVANLERGEISDVVRLPQGLALVQLEGIDAATTVPFEDVAFEMRGQLLQERRAERRQAALAAARAAFPASIDDRAIVSTAADYADLPVAKIGDETLTLADLDLAQRSPFLREAVQRAVDDELLLRLAEQQSGADTRAELERLRADVVADLMMDRLVQSQLSELREGELLARYSSEKQRFERPERRVFEVVRVAAESGNLQDARAAAEALARIWRPDGPIHQRNRAEVWGPITEERLAAATSAALARTAFDLAVGETTPPLLVEPGRGTSEMGYVLMRANSIEPAGEQSYEEARPQLVAEIEAKRMEEARTRARTDLLLQAGLKILHPLFDCDLHAPPARTEDAPAVSGQENDTPPASAPAEQDESDQPW